jgi:hypothetical protein
MIIINYEVFGSLSGKFWPHQRKFKSKISAYFFVFYLKHFCTLVPAKSIKVKND